MKRRALVVAAVVCLLLWGTVPGHAAGYGLYEYSARGNALGGAVVARADDPSALVFNPAGITQLEGTQVAVGFSAIRPELDVKINGDTTPGETNVWLPPHFYLTHKINDRWSVGIAEYSRFGLGTEFDEDWAGRYNLTKAHIQSYSINPNVAFKVTDELSVALGVEYVHALLDIHKKINLSSYGAPDAESHSKVRGDGYALTAGVHYKPNDQWRFGVGYHSEAKVDASGDQSFHDVASPLAGGFPSTHAYGSVVLPDMINFGVAYYPRKDLSVEVGAVYTRWSTYRQLCFNFDTPVAGQSQSNTNKEWHDVWRYNIGVEYQAKDWLTLRAGYVYDESPLNKSTLDYLVPANDRQIFSLGVGFAWEAWTLDVSYSYLWVKGRDFDTVPDGQNGVYADSRAENGRTNIYGVTVGYRF